MTPREVIPELVSFVGFLVNTGVLPWRKLFKIDVGRR